MRQEPVKKKCCDVGDFWILTDDKGYFWIDGPYPLMPPIYVCPWCGAELEAENKSPATEDGD